MICKFSTKWMMKKHIHIINCTYYISTYLDVYIYIYMYVCFGGHPWCQLGMQRALQVRKFDPADVESGRTLPVFLAMGCVEKWDHLDSGICKTILPWSWFHISYWRPQCGLWHPSHHWCKMPGSTTLAVWMGPTRIKFAWSSLGCWQDLDTALALWRCWQRPWPCRHGIQNFTSLLLIMHVWHTTT